LNTFELNQHSLQWPTALQVPSQDLSLRIHTLVSELTSISSVTPDTLSSWLAQFHALASKTQTADNLIRKDIGLPTTSSYP
jgi:hypothetical protein